MNVDAKKCLDLYKGILYSGSRGSAAMGSNDKPGKRGGWFAPLDFAKFQVYCFVAIFPARLQ